MWILSIIRISWKPCAAMFLRNIIGNGLADVLHRFWTQMKVIPELLSAEVSVKTLHTNKDTNQNRWVVGSVHLVDVCPAYEILFLLSVLARHPLSTTSHVGLPDPKPLASFICSFDSCCASTWSNNHAFVSYIYISPLIQREALTPNALFHCWTIAIALLCSSA